MGWEKALLFAGGMAASMVVKGAAGMPSVRRAAVNGVAKCMDFSDSVQSTTQSIIDDAEDLRAEARLQRQIDAAVDEKIALIEDEIREEVRARIEAAYAEELEDIDEPAGR